MRFLKKVVRTLIRIVNLIRLKCSKIDIGDKWEINGLIRIRNKGIITIRSGFIANSGKMKNPIGGDTILRLIVKKNAMLTVGSNVGISNSTIVCWESINIGNNVFIGGGCRIWDTDFHSLNPTERTGKIDNGTKTSPIVINDYAFIGGGSIILKGVTIGGKSIVAAGSVVTKNIPENEVWGGNPAKFIRKL